MIAHRPFGSRWHTVNLFWRCRERTEDLNLLRMKPLFLLSRVFFLIPFLSPLSAYCIEEDSGLPPPFIYTPERVDRALENSQHHQWAAELAESMQTLADEAAATDPQVLREWFTLTTPNDQTSCPGCGQYWLNYVWDWQPEHPDRLTCNYCGLVVEADTYPKNAVINRKTPQGEVIPHPVYRDEEGTTYPIWQTIGFKKANHAYDWIEALGVTYALTGDSRYAETAVHLLYRLAEVYPGYILHDNFRFDKYPWGWAGKLSGWHLTDARIFMRMGTAWDSIRQSAVVSAGDRTFIEENLFRKGGEMLTSVRPLQGISNDVAYRFGAVALIGRLLNDDQILAWVLDSDESYDIVLDHLFFKDGAWHERTLSYHNMMTRSVWLAPYYLDGYQRKGSNREAGSGRTVILRDHPKLPNIMELPFRMRFPDGTLPSVNDSRYGIRPQPDGPEAMYAFTGKEKWLAYTQVAYDGMMLDKGSLFSLFNRPPDIGDRLPEVGFDASIPETSEDFTGMGLFMLRRGSGENRTVFTLHHHKFANSHTHYDALSTILWAEGREMLSDLGYALFGIRERYTWYNASLSHNTLTVDTLNQRSPNGVANYIWHGELFSACEGESWDSYRFICEPFTRQIALVDGPDGTPYALDIFRGGGGTIHDFALHGEGTRLQVEGVDLLPVPGFPGKDYAYSEVRDVRSAPVEGPVNFNWQWEDGASLDGILARQESARLFTSRSPGMRVREQQGREIDSLFLRREGDNLRSNFIAAFDPNAGSRQVEGVSVLEVSEDADWVLVFEVDLAGGFTDYVFSAYIDVAPTGAVFKTDGLVIPWQSRFGIVRVRNGRIVREEWVDAPMEGLAHDI